MDRQKGFFVRCGVDPIESVLAPGSSVNQIESTWRLWWLLQTGTQEIGVDTENHVTDAERSQWLMDVGNVAGWPLLCLWILSLNEECLVVDEGLVKA